MAGFLRLFTAVENLITYPEICTMYRARYARACWGQKDRSPARPSEHLKGLLPSGPLEKDSPLTGATTWPPYNRFLWDIGSKFGLT